MKKSKYGFIDLVFNMLVIMVNVGVCFNLQTGFLKSAAGTLAIVSASRFHYVATSYWKQKDSTPQTEVKGES